MQEEIARQVIEALQLKLNNVSQQRLANRPTNHPEANRLYLVGRFYWNKYEETGFRKSAEYFQKAIGIDPNYALAYAGLADAYAILGVEHARPRDVFPQAKKYAEEAIRLDDTLAEAHNSLGIVNLFYEWNWAEAERAFRRARELDPTNSDVGHFYSHYFEAMGLFEEGIRETKRGLESAPDSLVLNTELGFAYYFAGQFDQAIEQYRKTLDMDQNFVFANWAIAQAYGQKKMYQEAIAVLNKARAVAPDWPFLEAEVAYVYARLGKRAKAQQILSALQKRGARSWVDPMIIAFIYAGLGDNDQTLAWLYKAYDERSTYVIWMKVEPKLAHLREEPRFKDLLRLVGLPQ